MARAYTKGLHDLGNGCWAWLQPDGTRGHETVVDVRLEKVDGGTRMALTQKTFATAATR